MHAQLRVLAASLDNVGSCHPSVTSIYQQALFLWPLSAWHRYAVQTPVSNNDAYNAWQNNHFRVVAARIAWNITTGSPDVRLCVVDTGIQADHPDLIGNIVGTHSVLPISHDDDGHGTHVSGEWPISQLCISSFVLQAACLWVQCFIVIG